MGMLCKVEEFCYKKKSFYEPKCQWDMNNVGDLVVFG